LPSSFANPIELRLARVERRDGDRSGAPRILAAGDEDALDLRFILEKMDLPTALDELQRTLSQIGAREPSR
jgi:hypothetical protein